MNITNKDECEWIWDLWGQQIEPLAAHMPYMTGVGNHEKFYNWTAFTHLPNRRPGRGLRSPRRPTLCSRMPSPPRLLAFTGRAGRTIGHWTAFARLPHPPWQPALLGQGQRRLRALSPQPRW